MLNLFSSANFNNLFKTPYVSLSVPGSQKSDTELEKTTELRMKDLCFVLFNPEAMLFRINQSKCTTPDC